MRKNNNKVMLILPIVIVIIVIAITCGVITSHAIKIGFNSKSKSLNAGAPFCGAINTRSEGWYINDAATKTTKLIKYDSCAKCSAVCKSEGWFSSCTNDIIMKGECSAAKSSTCRDSDGGKSYYVKGTCIHSRIYPYSSVDSCYLVSGTSGSPTKECSGFDCMLHEHFCQEPYSEYGCTEQDYNCLNGCKDGACICKLQSECPKGYGCVKGACIKMTPKLSTSRPSEPVIYRPPQQAKCKDTDGGKNFDKKGEIIGDMLESVWRKYDGCFNKLDLGMNDNLEEVFCENGRGTKMLHTCIYGCSEGRCAVQGEPFCANIEQSNEGWYVVENGAPKLVLKAKCKGCTAVCRGIGSRSEGWYDSCSSKIIKYAKCSSSQGSSQPPQQQPSTQTSQCNDPDGLDYFTKTTVTLGSQSETDECTTYNTNILYEMFCYQASDGSWSINTDNHYCQYGCDDGKCKRTAGS